MDVTECENCGGHVVFDAGSEAVKCLFCGDVSLNVSELHETTQPTDAVEFRVAPSDAQGLFRAWARSSFWAPRALRDARAELERVWVPAWRVRADVLATWTGLVSARTKSGKRPKSGELDGVREVWVPASVGLSAEELSALAPFTESEVIPWNPQQSDAPYEVGGLTARSATSQARSKFRKQVKKELIRRERLADCRVSALLEQVDARPLMLPVYIGCARFRDRPWRFVINGQTGRVTGQTPIDRRKVAVAALLVATAVMLWLWIQ